MQIEQNSTSSFRARPRLPTGIIVTCSSEVCKKGRRPVEPITHEAGAAENDDSVEHHDSFRLTRASSGTIRILLRPSPKPWSFGVEMRRALFTLSAKYRIFVYVQSQWVKSRCMGYWEV